MTKRRTQKERSEKTRNRIITATIKSLVEVGYRNTTTERILEKAGVSRGALQHHFPTRDLLFEEVFTYALDTSSFARFQKHYEWKGSLSEYLHKILNEFWSSHSWASHIFLLVKVLEVSRRDEETMSYDRRRFREYTEAFSTWWMNLFTSIPVNIQEEKIRQSGLIALLMIRSLLYNMVHFTEEDHNTRQLVEIESTVLTILEEGITN